MSTTKKPDDDLMQQLQEPALETVRLQARRSMSPEEQRLLANNLINMLLGRGLLPNTASASLLDDLVAQILAGYPGAQEEDIREALAGAKQASDGHWYIPDPARSREMVEVVPQSIDGPASAPKRQPSSCEADGGFVMNDNVIHLLPAEEEAILRCYVTGLRQPGSFRKLYDALEIPVVDTIPGIVSRLQIAVAQILLHHVQDSLPQWATMKGDELLLNRRRHKRHKDGLLPFAPRRLFSINWATSGPGYDWPEEYRITYLPGFDKYVFTASRDGDDMWECADHAIGVAEKSDNIQEAARKILTGYWRTQAEKGDQQRWEDCLAEGLILLGQTRYGLILKRKTATQRRMIVLELIISDAIRRAKTRVPRKGLSRVDRRRALIFEALTYIGWHPALAHRDAEAFSGGHWDEFVRGFADEWDRGRKPSRGHLLWGAKAYKLTPKQFDLLLGDEPLSSACLAHLAVRTFISIHPDVDGRVHRALFWTSRLRATTVQPSDPRVLRIRKMDE